MTMSRREVSRILAGCVQDPAQAETLRQRAEQPDALRAGLDNATAALLFAAAVGAVEDWHALTVMHPALAGMDRSNMVAVLERLFSGDRP